MVAVLRPNDPPPAVDDDAELEPWELEFIEKLARADAARLYAAAQREKPAKS